MKKTGIKRMSREIDRQETKAEIKASKRGKIRNPVGSLRSDINKRTGWHNPDNFSNDND